MDRYAELLRLFGWRWLLLLRLFMAGRSALLSKANDVEELAVCCAQWPPRGSARGGGLLGQGCLSGEEHPSWDRVATVHWKTHGSWNRLSGTPSCQQLEERFLSLFLFYFWFFYDYEKKKSNFLGHCSLYVQQNLFILQEIISAAFFGNMQFSWWETTHKQHALPKEAFQNVSSLN